MHFLKTASCLLLLCTLPGLALGEGLQPPARVHSTLERMTLPHLKAVHEDVQALKAKRRVINPLPGLYDYQAILHAHASDSDHTGGTREEILQDAKATGVDVIMLSDHFRPPRDFISDSWRGIREGVLFIPGSEAKGFLIYPDHSVMEKMELPKEAFIQEITAGEGLIFLSHVEERPDHPVQGLTGFEIYNRHADAKDDIASMRWLYGALVQPELIQQLEEAVKLYPDEWLAAQQDYLEIYLKSWDKGTQVTRLTGVAANDCHHNQVYLTKMVDADTVLIGTNVDPDEGMTRITSKEAPTIPQLTQGHQPGDVLARLDFDPYTVMMRDCATHILAPELSEQAIRTALKQGHVYVSHDWMCDPTGFYLWTTGEKDAHHALMGDEIEFSSLRTLEAQLPLSCQVRVIKDGELVHQEETNALSYTPAGPGVYRVEAWLQLDGELRPWIYSNPLYLR